MYCCSIKSGPSSYVCHFQSFMIYVKNLNIQVYYYLTQNKIYYLVQLLMWFLKKLQIYFTFKNDVQTNA